MEATDDFFTIGGNSLAATRLIFRLRDAFGVDLPLLTLYDEPTLAETAAAIDALRPGGPQAAAGDGAAESGDPATVAPDGDPPTAAASGNGGPGDRTGSAPAAGAPAGTSAPASIGITRRDRSAMRTNMASPPSPARPSSAAASPRTAAPAAATASPVPVDSSAPRPAGTPDHLIPLAPGWALWRWVCLRAAGFPFQMHAAVAGEALADAADQLVAASTSESPGAQRLAEAYDAQFAVSERELASALYAVGADPRFRTAVAWQNRTAMETGIDVLLRRDPLTVKRNGNYRRYEALIANYLQRYTAKNDSIGFFGPIGWVDVATDGPAITHRPHPPGALARRRLYFEEWAIQRLAESLGSGLDRWLVPRRLPLASIEPGADGPVLRIPFAPPASVDPLAAQVYTQIDGARNAAEVVARVLAEAAGPVTEASVWAALGTLRDLHVIAWQLEVAADDAWAAQSLRARLSTVDDPALRDPALAVLDELEAGKAVVDAASESGDPAALITSLTSLDETFTRLTGAAATRRPGAMYAGRTLVFEECLRPDDVAFSTKLFETLAAPLEIVLHAARWYTTAGAALFHRACLTVYRDRVSAAGSARIPLSEFWLDASSLIFDVHGKTVGPIGKVIRDRWAPVLEVPADVRRHQMASADIRDAALRAFAVSRPGWGAAREHSPDLMIAAESAAAIRDGDFLWVLGEIHPGMNTMRYATWVDYHPEPDAMRQAMRTDLGQPVAWHVQTAAFGSTPARLSNVLMGPQDWRVVFAPDSSGYDPRLARFVGDFDIEEIEGRLIVTSRVTGESMPFVELIADPLSSSLSQYFGLVPAGPHTPRITVDNLVIQRETWRFDAGTLTFAHIVDERARYVEIRRWILANDLPRYVFVRAQGEVKPIFVDLTSLSSVDLMCRLARRVKANHGDQGQLSVSEMLPTPDQLWLTDSQGRRYTSELRVCAADLLGRN